MKERPILFKAEMVNSILAGAKTQTRRLVNPQPVWTTSEPYLKSGFFDDAGVYHKCPFGRQGDRLWVRESIWQLNSAVQGIDDEYTRVWHEGLENVRYMADQEEPQDPGKILTGWDARPSIHMPRWASRITLEIKEVRVERLQDVSEEDAIAEGVSTWAEDYSYEHWDGDPDECRKLYRSLWESINGEGSWAANPWVWVVSFERVEGGK